MTSDASTQTDMGPYSSPFIPPTFTQANTRFPYFYPIFSVPPINSMTSLRLEEERLIKRIEELQNCYDELCLRMPEVECANFFSGMRIHKAGKSVAIITFSEILLRMLSQETNVSLPQICTKFLHYSEESRVKYYRQFAPYVLNEIKGSTTTALDKLRTATLREIPVRYMLNEPSSSPLKSIISVQVRVFVRDMPKLDHGFFKELIMFSVQEKVRSTHGKKFLQTDEEDVRVFYGIANAELCFTEDDDVVEDNDEEVHEFDEGEKARNNGKGAKQEKSNDKEIVLTVRMLKEDFKCMIKKTEILQARNQHRNTSKKKDKIKPVDILHLKMHWVSGLVPAERMYEACLQAPSVRFDDAQIIQANLPAWNPSSLSSNDLTRLHLQKLNHEQCDLVQRLTAPHNKADETDIQEGLYLLQGPPGTGKTTTTAALIVEFTRKYSTSSILVCTTSNQSLRELLMRVHALTTENHLKGNQDMVQMALIGKGKSMPDELSYVYVHNFASKLYQPLIRMKNDLRKLRKSGSSNRCEELYDQMKEMSECICQKIQALLHESPSFSIKPHTSQALNRLYNAITDLVDQSIKTDSMDIFLDFMTQIIETLKQGSFTFEEFLVQRAQIVFATLTASGRKWLKKQRNLFDILIVDEAGQALIPEVIIPMQYAPKLMIQIGDPQQLAPTVKSVDWNSPFAKSLMQTLMIEHSQNSEMLRMQYRMHPEICRWISREFYSNRLITAPSVLSRPNLWQSICDRPQRLPTLLQYPSIFFDITSGIEHNAKYMHQIVNKFTGSRNSISNQNEARLIIDLVVFLLLTCQLSPRDIGIITFYSAQCQLLKQIFDHQCNLHVNNKTISAKFKTEWQKQLLIDTVDGFQGGERAITLISCVRTCKSVGFLSDRRRLNVAFSRAQHARWVFGQSSALSESNSHLPSFLKSHCAISTTITTRTVETANNDSNSLSPSYVSPNVTTTNALTPTDISETVNSQCLQYRQMLFDEDEDVQSVFIKENDLRNIISI